MSSRRDRERRGRGPSVVAFPRNAASVSRAQRFFGLAPLSRATIARRRPAATRPLLRLMGSAASPAATCPNFSETAWPAAFSNLPHINWKCVRSAGGEERLLRRTLAGSRFRFLSCQQFFISLLRQRIGKKLVKRRQSTGLPIAIRSVGRLFTTSRGTRMCGASHESAG